MCVKPNNPGKSETATVHIKPNKFKDDSIAPIIAFDFDDTISIDGLYPIPGHLRRYSKDVINFLVDIGCKVVIWTSRDVAVNQDNKSVVDHLTPMINFLHGHGVKYSSINKSVQFAPYEYNGRKVYAHLYVDDRAYGFEEMYWEECGTLLMLHVLDYILTHVIAIDMDRKPKYNYMVNDVLSNIRFGNQVLPSTIDYFRQIVGEWNE